MPLNHHPNQMINFLRNKQPLVCLLPKTKNPPEEKGTGFFWVERKGHGRDEDVIHKFLDFSVINGDFGLAKTIAFFSDISLKIHWMSFATLVFCTSACPGQGAFFHIHGVLGRNVWSVLVRV